MLLLLFGVNIRERIEKTQQDVLVRIAKRDKKELLLLFLILSNVVVDVAVSGVVVIALEFVLLSTCR